MNRTLIIAEAGVNHNGDLNLALKLVDAAADAGADLVKFQTFSAERLAVPETAKAPYQQANTDEKENQYDMLRRLEISLSDHQKIIQRCSERGIGFLSTGFDIESVDLLVNLGQKLYKIPSGEITNLPYLRHIGRLNQPVIMSTGMSDLGEIEDALDVLEQSGTLREKIIVMHCTSQYPAPFEDVNLCVLPMLKSCFGVEIGYSDHTIGIEVAIAAVAMGAKVIEKHFTLDRNLPGPDHRASLIPTELAAMVSCIRNIEIALGQSIKRRTSSESSNALVVRKSIVAACDISAGEILTIDKLTTKRPGTGLSPMFWDKILGSISNRSYRKNDLIEL